MTSYLFRLLGGLAFLSGVAWTILVFATPSSAPPAGYGFAIILAAGPGVGLAFSGLLLLAIGEALAHLSRIARHTAGIARNTSKMSEALDPPKPRKDAVTNFNDAVQLFQAKAGKPEPGVAIRELATDALRQKGFLR